MNQNAINHILVATDLSARAEPALARALRLARRHGARLVALTVIERVGRAAEPADSVFPDVVERERHIERDALAEAEAGLRASIERLGRGASGEVRVRIGSAYAEIQEAARESRADLIVLGAHGRHFLRGLVLGTTAARVVRYGDRPVLLVRRPAGRSYRRLLVAVDFSEHSRRGLERARALAPNADVYLLHAYELWYEYPLRTGIGAEDVLRLHQEYEQGALERLRALARAAGLSDTTPCLIRHGYPAALIPKVAAEVRADLAVVGTRGLSGLDHVLLGSVAEHVLREAPCDVLAVPPLRSD